MDEMMRFYKNKKVFITGHTGFKGTWMCEMLKMFGADVTGYALKPPTNPSLFELSNTAEKMTSIIGDVRDYEHMKQAFEETQPEIVIHMAAQPLVRESYDNPAYTYDVNVMGTVNILECVRTSATVKSVVNVTTDKVYKNREWEWGYRENEELNGYDPYSNSKSCSELVTSSYKKSFFTDREVAITTVRAGNVIGGGDFADNRIIPDCVRAAMVGEDIIVRNPNSVRPYQHVLEPVAAYLMIAMQQYKNPDMAGCYNVGPSEQDCWTTGRLVELFCEKWNAISRNEVRWINLNDNGPHEANFLKLDCSRIKKTFGWKPLWDVTQAMDAIVEWSNAYIEGNKMTECLKSQIIEFFKRKVNE